MGGYPSCKEAPVPQRTFLDLGSYATIGITLVLFTVAIFTKGLTHDLLLEAGVFLVSAKLIIMGYRSALVAEEFRSELRQIRELLENSRRGAV
jgi:hypothetical protein